MIDLLVTRASELVTARTDSRGAVGAALRQLDVIADGAVAIDKGRIIDVGPSRVLPAEYAARRDAYVQLVIDTLPAARRWAEYCDVWCDTIAFTAVETERIAHAARALGYRLRLHADQVGDAGGAALAARLGASSADHLDNVSEAGIDALATSGVVGVLLPSVTYHMLEMTPKVDGDALVPAAKAFWPALVRRMIGRGMRLALSADYNPGTSPTVSMTAARIAGVSRPASAPTSSCGRCRSTGW